MESPVREVPTPLIGPPLESPNMPVSPLLPGVPLVQVCAPLKPPARPPALIVEHDPVLPVAPAAPTVLPGAEMPGVDVPGVDVPLEDNPAADPNPATRPVSSWPKKPFTVVCG